MAEFVAITERNHDQFTPEDFAQHLDAEMARARLLYDQRIFRTIWGRDERRGVVVLMEADSAEAATQIWNTMPLVAHGMIRVQILPLVAYWGFTAAAPSDARSTDSLHNS